MILTALLLLSIPLGPPPSELGLDPFYRKYIDLGGIPVVGSGKVSDAALIEAYRIGGHMLRNLPKAHEAMVRNRVRLAIMAKDEVTTDIPEHRDLNTAFPETDWNKRARGLGATRERPAVSAAEENLLHLPGDRYRGENILIHEFAHAIMDMGLRDSDPTFMPDLRRCYERAKAKGLWTKTYAITNPGEYWAETAQSYFDANRRSQEPNGIHNHVGTREELAAYDPEIFRLHERVFGRTAWRYRLPRSSANASINVALRRNP